MTIKKEMKLLWKVGIYRTLYHIAADIDLILILKMVRLCCLIRKRSNVLESTRICDWWELIRKVTNGFLVNWLKFTVTECGTHLIIFPQTLALSHQKSWHVAITIKFHISANRSLYHHIAPIWNFSFIYGRTLWLWCLIMHTSLPDIPFMNNIFFLNMKKKSSNDIFEIIKWHKLPQQNVCN